MPTTKTVTLYQFDELPTDRAKEAAREWFRLLEAEDYDAEYVVEDFVRVAEMIGVTFKTYDVRTVGGSLRNKPCIWWSLSYSQGDGANFEGSYYYRKGFAKAVREYAPQDERLHDIVDRLQAVQARNFYQLQAVIADGHYGGSYTHENMVSIEVERNDGKGVREDDAEEVARCMRDLMRWLHSQLQKDYEWRLEDEQIEESIRSNEYTFTCEGRRED